MVLPPFAKGGEGGFFDRAQANPPQSPFAKGGLNQAQWQVTGLVCTPLWQREARGDLTRS